MTRMIRTHLRQVVVAAALMGLVAVPAAYADLAVQHDSTSITETSGNGNGVPEPGDTVAVTENVVSSSTPTRRSPASTGTLATSLASANVGSASSAYPIWCSAGRPATEPVLRVARDTMECGVAVPLTLSFIRRSATASVTFDLPTGSAGAYGRRTTAPCPACDPRLRHARASTDLTVGGSGPRQGHSGAHRQITHTYDGDLTITLISPDNHTVKLVGGKGDSGDDFVDTVFDDARRPRSGRRPRRRSPDVQPASRCHVRRRPAVGHLDAEGRRRLTRRDRNGRRWGLDVAPAVCTPQIRRPRHPRRRRPRRMTAARATASATARRSRPRRRTTAPATSSLTAVTPADAADSMHSWSPPHPLRPLAAAPRRRRRIRRWASGWPAAS